MLVKLSDKRLSGGFFIAKNAEKPSKKEKVDKKRKEPKEKNYQKEYQG